jgi:peptidyl-prolyl cis-trans isomerase A (cyclophilin A)
MLRRTIFLTATSLLLSTSLLAAEPHVLLKTTAGDIEVELNSKQAPISTKNFLTYVDRGFYKGTVFHRVIPNFMIQGGGMDTSLREKPTLAPIKNEANNGLKNLRGTLAMARTQVVDSATAQFFINQQDNDFLNNGARDFGYAVFGKVIKGMDVVDKISHVQTTDIGMNQNVPVQPIIILDAKRVP